MKKLSKRLFAACTIIISWSLLSFINVSAEVEDTASTNMGVTLRGFNYTDAENNTVKITGYSGSDENVTIPDIIDGKVVSVIDKDSFSRKSIRSISIPGSVIAIEVAAFEKCDKLETVEFRESGLQRIAIKAFGGCKALSGFEIPETVTSIGDMAFQNAVSLKSITIPSGVTHLGWDVFGSCTNITQVVLCDGLTLIGDSMFSGCMKLSSITIPDSIKEIGDYAFSLTNIKEVYIPKSVQRIGYASFNYEVTIQCYQDSTAYRFAKKNGNKIAILGPHFKENEVTIYEDATKALKVVNASNLSDWKSSNKKVVKVSKEGVITPVSKGEAIISVIVDGQEITCKVTVNSLRISKNDGTVTVGKKLVLHVYDASSKPVWKSSNSKVASVSSKGVVTGKKIGSATITAVIKGKSYSCKIKVMENACLLYDNSSDYSEPNLGLCITKIYYSGKSLVLEGYAVNNTSEKVTNIVNLQLTLNTVLQTFNNNFTKNIFNTIAEQKITDYKLNLSPHSKEKVKFVIDSKNVKSENIDLRNVELSVGYDIYYLTSQ